MKGKRFLSVILVIVMIIEIISPMFFKEVLAVESTNNEMNSETTEETTEETAEEQASEEQTNEEVSREYEIKEEETWDISENGDGSVIAKWTLSVKTLRISGNGKMRNWEYYNDREDWHSSQYTNIIEKLIIEDGVTNIGKNAFLECNNLNSIEKILYGTEFYEQKVYYSGHSCRCGCFGRHSCLPENKLRAHQRCVR